MSTRRIMARSTSPGLAEDPARTPRVVAELVRVGPSALDREEGEPVRTLAAAPFPRHLANANHPALPTKPQRPHPAIEECGEDVHGLVQGLEHGSISGRRHHSARMCR